MVSRPRAAYGRDKSQRRLRGSAGAAMQKEQYKTLTVEAAKTGWIVREKGKPAEVFVRWERVVAKLEAELTSKGDGGDSA